MRLELFLLSILLSITTLWAKDIDVSTKYYLDTHHELSLETVYDHKERFIELKKNSFGLIDDTLWLYVTIKNTTTKQSSNVIQMPYPLMDHIFVLEYVDHIEIKRYETGDLVPFSKREIKSNDIVIPYTLEPLQTKEFIFKIDTQGSLSVGMEFSTREEYHQDDKMQSLILGSYYGAVVIMLLYNFILFLMIKDRVYLTYISFHISFLLLQLGLNGLSFEFLWPTVPQINLYFVPLMLLSVSFTAIVFTLSFLDFKGLSPRLYRSFRRLSFVYLFLMTLVFFMSYSDVIKIIAFASILSTTLLFALGIYILVKFKTTSARFYVVAWSFILVGVLLNELQHTGLLPMNFFTLYSSQIGAFLELALLSFALAYKYNTIFVRLDATQAQLRVLNSTLELKVQERTKEQNRLLSLFDIGEVSLFKWSNDPQRSTQYASKNVSSLFGYSNKEFNDRSIFYHETIDKESLPQVKQALDQAIQENKTFLVHKPYKIKSKLGETKWVLDNTQIVRDHNGDVSYFLAYIVDITDLKKYETNLEELVATKSEQNFKQFEMLQQQSKLASMGEMINSIAHQWRQPLAVSNTIISILKEKNHQKLLTQEYTHQKLDEIERTNLHMSETIENFLTFFSPSKNKEAFTLLSIIRQAVSIIQQSIEEHSVTITIEIDPTLSLVGFKEEYLQVVISIVTNALHALKNVEEKEIVFRAFKKHDTITLTIKDTAGGIHDSYIHRVFEPYFTTKHQSEGTGLGLYIAKMIIEKSMYGSLSVKNSLKGAEFIITVPADHNRQVGEDDA